MQCNIDAKGKAVRLITGAAVGSVALIVAALWFQGILPEWTGFAAAGVLLGGLFMMYEGLSGWCAVRAMGFKTPL